MKRHLFLFVLPLVLAVLPSFLGAQAPCRQVIGYCPNWQWYDRNHLVNPMTIQYEKYTILNYCFFRPQASGHIVSTDAWADENLLLGQINWQTNPPSYVPNTSIPARAHNAGIQVVASIGGWNDSDHFPGIAASPAARAIFAHDCVLLCDQYDFDGVDIDWEYPGYAPHNGTPADKQNFTIFLQQIRDSLTTYGLAHGKTMRLTACVGASPANMTNIEWGNITPILDFINLMSYDFFGSWDNTTNHNAPLDPPAQGDPAFNVSAAVNALLNTYNVPPAKLTAGIAFYGRSVKTPGAPTLHGPQTHNPDVATFPDDDGSPLYYNLLPKLGLFSQQWDGLAKVPYLLGVNGLNTFVSFDNKASIAAKANFINQKNLAGSIIWEITGDYLEGPPGQVAGTPLLDTLNTRFCDLACVVPSSLAAVPAVNTAALSWSSTGATSYEIQYKLSTATNWTTKTSTSNSYTLTNLTACKSYVWKVKSICGAGNASAFSAQAAFSTTGCCSKPTVLNAVPAPAAIAISWNNTGAATYTLQWKLKTATAWQSIPGITATNYNLTGLAACTEYNWRVQGHCAGGTVSGYTASKTVKTTGCAGCPAPTVFLATPAATSAVLQWSDMGASGYTLQWRPAGTTAWTTVASLTAPTHTLSGLASCGSYQYRVKTICGASSSAYSATKTFATLCPPTCAEPTGLAASGLTNSAANLSWGAVAAAISYTLQWRATGATTWANVPGLTSTTYSLSGLSICTGYEYRVSTVCASASSNPSAAANFTTTGCSSGCAAPTGLAAVPQGTSAALSWMAVAGATAYNLQWKTASGSTWTTVSGLTTASYALTGLAVCTNYVFKTQAVCGSNTSAYSAEMAFQTTDCATPPPAPVNYCASFSTNSAAEWIQFFQMGTFQNASGNNGGFGNFINMGPTLVGGTGALTRFKPSFSGAPMNEFWRMWADWNRDGDFADVGELLFTVNQATADTITQMISVPVTVSYGYARLRISMRRDAAPEVCAIFSPGEVEDYHALLQPQSLLRPTATRQATSDFEIFPNPGTESVHVRFQADAPAEFWIELFDSQGVRRAQTALGLLPEGAHQTEISSLAALPPGIYWVALRQAGKPAQTLRWVKI